MVDIQIDRAPRCARGHVGVRWQSIATRDCFRPGYLELVRPHVSRWIALLLPKSWPLCVVRNMPFRDNELVPEALRELKRRLPRGWQLNDTRAAGASESVVQIRVTAPSQWTGRIVLEPKQHLHPKDVGPLVESTNRVKHDAPLVVVARYLSSSTRDRLREFGVGYLDLTGNAYIVVNEPGLFIQTQGATTDPNPQRRPVRSLRGVKAGRIARALIDYHVPRGVRELASIIGMDAGYVSRVLALLDAEALVARAPHGRLQRVDWSALLRRWAADAPIESRGKVSCYLEPRGTAAFIARLTGSKETYAITSSFAAAVYAPVVAAAPITVWMRDVPNAAQRLNLVPAESDANVRLMEPLDDNVFDGVLLREGSVIVAPSQVAADLLTSSGRGPAKAEVLIEWMRANEPLWRK